MPERGGVPQLDVLLRDFDQRLRQLETHQHHEVPDLTTQSTSDIRDFAIFRQPHSEHVNDVITTQIWEFDDSIENGPLGQKRRGWDRVVLPSSDLPVDEGFFVAVAEVDYTGTPSQNPFEITAYYQPNGVGTALGIPLGHGHVHTSEFVGRLLFPAVGYITGQGEGFRLSIRQSSGTTLEVETRLTICVWAP